MNNFAMFRNALKSGRNKFCWMLKGLVLAQNVITIERKRYALKNCST